jgi:cupin superfamily acireductone dioxygenase involved in methionine salvage
MRSKHLHAETKIIIQGHGIVACESNRSVVIVSCEGEVSDLFHAPHVEGYVATAPLAAR